MEKEQITSLKINNCGDQYKMFEATKHSSGFVNVSNEE